MENLLTVKETAEILKVKKNTVYEMIKRGDVKASKLGKQLRIRKEDLDYYIQYGKQAGMSEMTGTKEVIFKEEKSFGQNEDRIILCGQDLVLDLLADRLNRILDGVSVLRSYKGSYNGLYAMYQGEVDMATAHLWHGKTNSYNIPYISGMLPGMDVVVLHLLKRKEGFYVKKGNPKKIRDFQDLRRPDVTIVNREPGSGVRVLLDEKLRVYGIRPLEVSGYDHVVNSHLEAAVAVNRGEADVALGSEKHSRSVEGIDFLFVQNESYDLIIRKEDFEKELYQKMVSVIRSEDYRKEVEGLGGYDTTDMGKIIYRD
ncbi:MAG: helix-turn-helix transcriptional regulator [Anaerobutyricum sp.]|nr:helix-turn-helix transcriptional regulator [Anaerobutyricum sp.]